MKYYPIAVDLFGKQALVVGGGKVAERKTISLLKGRAGIRVVSPVLTPRLNRLAKSGKIAWNKRCVSKKDINGADIIIAATGNSAVNKNVSKWAKEKNVLVNVVDNSGLSDFISPAIVRQGKALIAVYTDGKDPVLSRDLKNYLKDHWDAFLSYRRRSQKSSS